MPLFKNLAGQKAAVYAYDTSGARTGDASNITGQISKNGGAPAAIADTNPTEIGGGWYVFDLTQAETNADLLLWYAASTTSGVTVEGGAAYTIEHVGGLPTVDVGSVAGSVVDAAATVESTIPEGVVAGTPTTTTTPMTGSDLLAVDDAYSPTAYVQYWLWPTSGAYAGHPRRISGYVGATKTATHEAFPTALTVGTSVRVVANPVGGSLSAADIRSAVGLASANLDTQLSTITTTTNTIVGHTGTSGVVVASASKTGYSLASSGMDAIIIDSGINARQAISVIAASAAGVLSGADTTSITIKGLNTTTTRIVATVDANGNRSAVTLTLPS